MLYEVITSAVIGQKASNLVDTLTVRDAVKSITATEIDFSSLQLIIDPEKKISSDKWKLGLGAIGRIRSAKSRQDLLKIMKEEIAKALGIEEDEVNISLEIVNQLLEQIQRKSKSVYDEAIGKSIEDFSKDMRDVVGRYTDKKPTIYVDQGTALKVFVNQDIVFPPQAILNQ